MSSEASGVILGIGNPLLDISAVVPMTVLEKCVLADCAQPPIRAAPVDGTLCGRVWILRLG